MTNTHKFLFLSAVTGMVLLLAPVNAWAQRGASGPPEPANVEPVNYRPNPYQVVRDWGHLPDERSWGSVSAVNVDIDGRHIWAGDRCGTNSCATTPNIDPIVKLDPYGNVVQELGAGQPITGLIDEGHCREEEEKQAERGRSHHLDRPTLQGIADHTQRDQPVSDPYV